jgi:hypothetical protein
MMKRDTAACEVMNQRFVHTSSTWLDDKIDVSAGLLQTKVLVEVNSFATMSSFCCEG